MSKQQLANDEVVRRLNSAYEADKLRPASGDEFLAAVGAKAVSVLVFRLVVVLGILMVVAIGVVGYQLATSDQSMGEQASGDPGGAPAGAAQPR